MIKFKTLFFLFLRENEEVAGKRGERAGQMSGFLCIHTHTSVCEVGGFLCVCVYIIRVLVYSNEREK